MMTSEEVLSTTIRFLRFPLIVGVVIIHACYTGVVDGYDLMQGRDFPIYINVSYLFSNIFARLAVPLFFFFSGFLFFYKTVDFVGRTYLSKLKKRFRTVLVPYFLWNLLLILLLFSFQSLVPGLLSGKDKLVVDYTPSDWVSVLLVNPIDYPLWFIRDLMVVFIFSPLLYFLLNVLKCFFILLLGGLWLLGFWDAIAGLNTAAFFFFSVGAYFSIHKRNFVKDLIPFLPISVFLYALLVIVQLCFKEQTWSEYIHKAGILSGIILVITLTARMVSSGKWKVNDFLSCSSFFIYAYHAMPLAIFIKIMLKFIHPHSDGMMLVIYLFCPFVIMFVGLLLYYLTNRYFPRITSVLTGGR